MVPAKKNLFEACFETLSEWTLQYQRHYGTAIEYAIIACAGQHNKTLVIAICEGQSMPPEAKELERITFYNTPHLEGDSNKEITYPVIGVIEEGILHLNCGEQYFTTFFSSTGETLLNNIIVEDSQITANDAAFEKFVEEVEQENIHLSRSTGNTKKQRRAQTHAKEPSRVKLARDTEQESEAIARKREKRRAKELRQKERRRAMVAEAGDAGEVEKANRRAIMEEVRAGMEAMENQNNAILVDSTTDAGRCYLEEARAQGWDITEVQVRSV